MTGKTIKQRWARGAAAAMAAAAFLTLGSVPAMAGEWQPQDDGGWKYEEDGAEAAGWVSIDGFWHLFDPETGLLIQQPPLNQDTVCYLLENAVKRAGWYQTEDSQMVYHVDEISASGKQITVSILLETQPAQTTGTLNTFVVNLANRTAKSQATKLTLDL